MWERQNGDTDDDDDDDDDDSDEDDDDGCILQCRRIYRAF